MKSYCLNLHERYAPDWGVWECARELYANAKDACPDDMRMTSPNANTLELYTPTVPDLSQLFIIGCGTKDPKSDDIGQFGEGVKLTALASTRQAGNSLTIRLPNETISFAIRDHLGQRVLFADVVESDPFEGCLCTLVMSGAGYAMNGKILGDAKPQWIPKAEFESVQIFCKGIWITSLEEKNAMFSYNLNDLQLNRDRSHADPWSIRHAIGRLLINQMDSFLAERIAKRPLSWETDKCLSTVGWIASDTVKRELTDALKRVHGDRVVVYTSPKTAVDADKAGFKSVMMGEGLRDIVAGSIPLDTAVTSNEIGLKPVKFKRVWKDARQELTALAVILGLPDVTINTFADRPSELLGKADIPTQTVWLNERLWHADNRFERIRTFLHEFAHIQSGAGDQSFGFEYALDLIAGKLGIRVLDGLTSGTD